jgi:hypothetical protein
MLDGVAQQIGKDLSHASGIELRRRVFWHVGLKGSTRMRSFDLFKRFSAESREISRHRHDLDPAS